MPCSILHKRSAKRNSTGNAFTQVENKGFVKSVRPSFRALAIGGKHREGGGGYQ
jgi:hypothetical protein